MQANYKLGQRTYRLLHGAKPDSGVFLNGTIPDPPSAMLTFITEFLKHPSSVGAVAPSSRYLTRTILAAADGKNCHVIVEFGPGTGAFTKYLCQQLRPNQRYIGIELNTTFARLLRAKIPDLNLRARFC